MTGHKPDLLAAIEAGRAGLAAAEASGRYGPLCRGALASALLEAHHLGEPGLREALELDRTVVDELDIDDDDYASALVNLVNALRLTFLAERDPELLDEAVVHGREALALSPRQDVHRAALRIPLSQALFQQAILSSSVARLVEARQLAHEALADPSIPKVNRAAILQYVSVLDRAAEEVQP